jgi:hypothetical protein
VCFQSPRYRCQLCPAFQALIDESRLRYARSGVFVVSCGIFNLKADGSVLTKIGGAFSRERGEREILV